ncbi:hypothetical protein PAB09_11965 [Corynebacterium sp. SCR221107]|nr:hypothetical protein [Corynebacterium sp. SCR221107]WBT08562.1 hypothetical protein PAB09_11965 [Corynebacterium sp. SCR221107]
MLDFKRLKFSTLGLIVSHKEEGQAMKATYIYGPRDVRVEERPAP